MDCEVRPFCMMHRGSVQEPEKVTPHMAPDACRMGQGEGSFVDIMYLLFGIQPLIGASSRIFRRVKPMLPSPGVQLLNSQVVAKVAQYFFHPIAGQVHNGQRLHAGTCDGTVMIAC